MNFNKYTIKSQEVIQQASEIALGNTQQAVEPGHLMKAILTSDENMIAFLLKKLNVGRAQIEPRLEEIIKGYPKVSGGNPYLGQRCSGGATKSGVLPERIRRRVCGRRAYFTGHTGRQRPGSSGAERHRLYRKTPQTSH
jgi:hypothetical protein